MSKSIYYQGRIYIVKKNCPRFPFDTDFINYLASDTVSYPVTGNHQLKDGQEVVEGKDYTKRHVCCISNVIGWENCERQCDSDGNLAATALPSPAPCQFCKGTHKITVHNTTAGPEFEERDCPCCVGVTVNCAFPAPGVVEQTAEVKFQEGGTYYPLFKFFSEEYNLTLMDGEIQDIINQVNKFQAVEPEKGEDCICHWFNKFERSHNSKCPYHSQKRYSLSDVETAYTKGWQDRAFTGERNEFNEGAFEVRKKEFLNQTNHE